MCLELTRVGEAEAATALTPRRLSKRSDTGEGGPLTPSHRSKRSDTGEGPLTPSRRTKRSDTGEGPLTPSRRSEGPLTPSRRSRRLSSSLGGTDQQLLHLAPDGGVITRGSLSLLGEMARLQVPEWICIKKKIYAFLGWHNSVESPQYCTVSQFHIVATYR